MTCFVYSAPRIPSVRLYLRCTSSHSHQTELQEDDVLLEIDGTEISQEPSPELWERVLHHKCTVIELLRMISTIDFKWGYRYLMSRGFYILIDFWNFGTSSWSNSGCCFQEIYINVYEFPMGDLQIIRQTRDIQRKSLLGWIGSPPPPKKAAPSPHHTHEGMIQDHQGNSIHSRFFSSWILWSLCVFNEMIDFNIKNTNSWRTL